MAATKFRFYFERSMLADLKSMDLQKIRVDGQKNEPMSGNKIDAMNQISNVKAWLGINDYRVIERVCGHGDAIGSLGESDAKRRVNGVRLRDGLDLLAQMWNLMSSGR